MLKRNVCIVLSIVLICVLTTTCFASSSKVNSDASTRMTHIMTFDYNLSIDSSGKSTSSASLECYPGVAKVRINIYLQQYNNGYWTTIKNWSEYYTGTYGQMSRIWYVMSGHWYRIRVNMYAYQGSTAVESVSRTSNSVWF